MNPPVDDTTISLTKMDIIGILAARNQFTRYLELCSRWSGNQYAELDRTVLPNPQRLMYYCPANFDDGLPIDFRSEDLRIKECIDTIRSRQLHYDMIFVDPWHQYETSMRDIRAAFALVDEGGLLLVHDCLPPNAEVARPTLASEERLGEITWCGATYKAYLDFVGYRDDLEYFTVDTDYGCGIIRKLPRNARWEKSLRALGVLFDTNTKRRTARDQNKRLWAQWRQLGDDFDGAFSFFDEHKRELLKLIAVDDFLKLKIG